jgi:hypothetical protein
MIRDLIETLNWLYAGAPLYFSRKSAPMPQPVAAPVNPSSSAASSEEAKKAADDRQVAQREVLDQEANSGRKTTIFAGKEKEEEQAGRGLLARRGRAASKDLLT